ncbi:FAD-dependent oxidoreductase [Streptomyces sp. NBC_00038]|uniref:flavin monoamine oxidase family protein n=1 Tax=Streptomyces sp. NBC_00038 TaxID=2903615 RepID=UPI002251DDCC|nr:FAD-dependent oxidoreductase [Streptomyces sp. NBC_00038]MCX5563474.1 FAD-dependent oxidoreductase [Streptomyces sp. NBC_00038]
MTKRVFEGLSRRGLLAAAAGSVVSLAGCAGTEPRSRAGGRGVPDPVSFLRTSWSTDPLALCSYSFLAPSPLGVDVRTRLASSVGGRLHFAGEATSSEAPATTTGALISGRRAARDILKTARPGHSVTVVGAGFAGLGCARALTDAGVRVTVLEGRDRTGGRAWTKQIAGVPAEMGASWIHDWRGGNPVGRLLKQSGGRSSTFDYESVDGEDKAAMAELQPYTRKVNDAADPDTTAIGDLLPDKPSAALRWAANETYTQEYAAEPDQIAVSALEEGTGGSGGDVLLPDGYDKLIAEVQGDIKVRTGATVTGVRHDSTGTTLTLDGGEEIEADHTVITVPIGVLKAGRIAFDPPLPDEKQQAIDALGAGLLDKLWLEFDEVFWDRDASVIEWFDHDDPGLWAYWINGHKAFGKPVLLGFNAGAYAHRLAEHTDQQVVTSALTALRGMYP